MGFWCGFFRRGYFLPCWTGLTDWFCTPQNVFFDCFLFVFVFAGAVFSLAGQDSLIGWFCRCGVQPEELATGRGHSLLRQPDSGHS